MAENGRRDDHQQAVEGLASDIAERAEPHIAQHLTKSSSTRVDSETAHRIAAEIARNADRRRSEK